MALAQQVLGFGVGANLAAAHLRIGDGSPKGAMGDGLTASCPVIPGAGHPAWHLPHPPLQTPGLGFCRQIGLGVALTEVLAVGEGVPFCNQGQVDRTMVGRPLADHLCHGAAVAVGGLELEEHRAAKGQGLLQGLASQEALLALADFRGINASQANGEALTAVPDPQGVAIADGENRGGDGACGSGGCS